MNGRTPENAPGLNPPLSTYAPATGDVWLVSSSEAVEAGKKLGRIVTQAPPEPADEWIEGLHGRDVVVAFDCDEEGRKRAADISARLPEVVASVRLVDLNPTATDGYNLATYLADADGAHEQKKALAALLALKDNCERVYGVAPSSPGASWRPINLVPYVESQNPDPPPELLARTDGECLLYREKIHTFQGEPEACKGWLLLHASAQAIEAGESVVYFDFEDGPGTAVGRLKSMGVTPEAIGRHFHYAQPDEAIGESHAEFLDEALALQPALVVIDGVTEALTIEGLSLNDNADVALWQARLPRRFLKCGAAVALIDHVTKDKEGRGRYALGAQHKLAGVHVTYSMEVAKPFGIGQEGRVKVWLQKDRPGHVGKFADNTPAGRRVADFRLTSHAEDSVAVALEPARRANADEWRPHYLMEQVSRVVEGNGGIATRNITRGPLVGHGSDTTKEQALDYLIMDGFVERRQEGQKQAHYSLRRYREDEHDPEKKAQGENVVSIADRLA